MRRPPRTWKAALSWAVASLFVWATASSWLAYRVTADLPPVDSPFAEPVRDASAPSRDAIPDRIGRGDTLSDVLGRNGFTPAEVHDAALALSAIMDVRRLRAGNEIEIRYDETGKAISIGLDRHDLRRIELTRTDLGWQSESEEIELTRRVVSLSGTLEGNLFSSMSRLGEGAPLTIAFARVFAWDFDFYTQSREGDRFSLVVEKLYLDDEFRGYGELRAASYESKLSSGRVLNAFLYEDPNGNRDYYDRDGKSTRKAFLRAPLEFERISSGFSRSRLHPIHKRRMPHLGVDYAARTGTPVYSVAAGVVTGRAFGKANGNMVTVKHAMGYTTKYLHLSKYASGLAVGQRVEQKQLVGYVGMTGSATGPHLDFRLIRHGKAVNPVTQIFPPGPPVAEEYFPAFEKRREILAQQLRAPVKTGRSVAVDDS